MYDWSSSRQAACINSLTIWLSVISELISLRCLTRIASSCDASGEILIFRGRRPAPGRLPPQFGLAIISFFKELMYNFFKVFILRFRLFVVLDVLNHCFLSAGHRVIEHPIKILLQSIIGYWRIVCHVRKSFRFYQLCTSFLVHLNNTIYQDESQVFSSEFLTETSQHKKLMNPSDSNRSRSS